MPVRRRANRDDYCFTRDELAIAILQTRSLFRMPRPTLSALSAKAPHRDHRLRPTFDHLCASLGESFDTVSAAA